MRKNKVLLSFYKYPRKNGIFYSMSKVPEFKNLFNRLDIIDDNDFHSMDFDYIYNHSGIKSISVMLQQIISGYVVDDDGDFALSIEGKRVTWDYVMQQVDQDIINNIIKFKYLKKWSGLVDSLNYSYDPLSPFSMSISEDIDNKLSSKSENSNTRNIDSSGSGNNSNKSDSTENGKVKNSDAVYGFNSTNPVDTDASSETNDVTIKNSNSGSNSYSDNEKSSYKSNDSYSRDSNIKRSTKRSGNIGNLSSQQLIEQQRKLLMYQIFDTIYDDLDEILTRSKYN